MMTQLAPRMQPVEVSQLPSGACPSSIQLYLSEIAAFPLLSYAEECELAYRVQAGDKEAEQHFLFSNLRLVVSLAKQYSTSDLELLDHIQNGFFGLRKAVKGFNPACGFRFSTYATRWIRQTIKREQQNSAHIIRLPVYIQDQWHSLDQASETWVKRHGTEPPLEYLATVLGVGEKHIELLQSRRKLTLSLDDPGEAYEDYSLSERVTDPEAEIAYSLVDETLSFDEMSAALQQAMEYLTKQERAVVSLYFGIGCEAMPVYAEIARALLISRTRARMLFIAGLAKLRSALQPPIASEDELEVAR
jgi:RNA polymerase primary sigma factor